jgi:hypothetical protein
VEVDVSPQRAVSVELGPAATADGVAFVAAFPGELESWRILVDVVAVQVGVDDDEGELPGPVVEELDESAADEIDGIAIPQIHLDDSPPTSQLPFRHAATVPVRRPRHLLMWERDNSRRDSSRRAQPSAEVPSPRVFVSDLRHFLDLPDDAPGPARRIAEQLSLIVRAATAGDAGLPWVSALGCRRRPGRTACPGHIAVYRSDVPPSIEWRCTACGDEGVISGWEQSPFDLRARSTDAGPSDEVQIVIDAEVAATLRSLMLIDTAGERLVFRAHPRENVIVLTGSDEDLDELTGYVAAEANHEADRRRQKRLDAAFTVINDALNRLDRE